MRLGKFKVERLDYDLVLNWTPPEGEMTRRELLAAAVRKWERLERYARRGFLVDDNGSNSCPLCQEYLYTFTDNELEERCSGCPVSRATGESMCGDTPYHLYDQACLGDQLLEAEQAAGEERLFLAGLLEELDDGD